MEPKFKTGDKVRIVNYGHLIWRNKENWAVEKKYLESIGSKVKDREILYSDEKTEWIDIAPERVGKETVITGVSDHPNPKYTYKTELFSWATEGQLELIE